MVAPLSRWPWEHLGPYKYLLYGPIIGKMMHSRLTEGAFFMNLYSYILLLCGLRIILYWLWSNFSCMLFLNQNRRVTKRGYDFKQIDEEWDWDNFLILQALVAFMIQFTASNAHQTVPSWETRGFFIVLILHIAVLEPLYYWIHRFFHQSSYFFTHHHIKLHSSPVLHPFTGVNATPLEQILLAGITSIPLLGTFLSGFGSKSVVYAYILAFDFLQCFANSNVELVPYQLFEWIPLLKYFLQTPTYRSLHHKDRTTNFCLFMPIFDSIWGTCYNKSLLLHKEINSADTSASVPDFVFLAHMVDVMSSMHVPFGNRSLASIPFRAYFFLFPLLPLPFAFMVALWAWAKPFVVSGYLLKGRLDQMWVVPRYGFQYFLPFCRDGINNQIEEAILKADKLGVKVISLAALNKNEALNRGGTLFVEKHPELRIRVVHGNTLTAAVIINELSKDCPQVFLTGATSKLGRAIALYLCRKGKRVLMLTRSTERFQKIKNEAPAEFQHYLVQVTKYEAAQSCKTWIVGKWISPSDQNLAPKGTHFYQFVVPPILPFRRDCTYGDLAAMKLPTEVEGLGYCEYTLERGVVHACHAGGVVHLLEGYTHHEVGAIDVDRIDVVWKAAMKHGLKPVSD